MATRPRRRAHTAGQCFPSLRPRLPQLAPLYRTIDRLALPVRRFGLRFRSASALGWKRTERSIEMTNTRFCRGSWSVPGVLAVLLVPPITAKATPAIEPAREQVIRIVDQIRRADYEGDREALRRLRLALTPFVVNRDLSSRVHYWRGFALWRRALNGFNDHVDPKDLQADLLQAMDDFEDAVAKDPGFVDAKVAALGCAGYLAFATGEKDNDRIQHWIAKGETLQREAQAADPSNPRLMWVDGPG